MERCGVAEREEDGRELAAELASALESHRKTAGRLLRLAKALSKPWRDAKAVQKAAGEAAKLVPELPQVAREASALLDASARWLQREREGRRQKLARDLKDLSAARGVRLAVVTKDPLEIRLPPLGVRIDLEKGRAAIVFGQVELRTCAATGDEILEARRKALEELERPKWSAPEFHRQLRGAWSAAARRLGRADGWVELAEVIAEVAVAIQGPRWRQDPTARNFTSYGKAHFLYDLHRLREAGALSVDGYRLALGPATGASTRDKKRVFWVEDGDGRGAYHLTLRFVREEEIHGEET
ncbi:MAG: hypothetical protein ACUVYA_04100 [Planctomycetota bacterium]